MPGVESAGGFDYKGHDGILGVMELFHIVNCVLQSNESAFVNSLNYTLKQVNFTVYKLHLNKSDLKKKKINKSSNAGLEKHSPQAKLTPVSFYK